MKKSGWLWGGVGIVVGVSLTAAVWATLSFSGSNRICSGVTIEGINVGGMTKDQCKQLLIDWSTKQAAKRIVLTALDKRWTGAIADFGTRFDWPKALDQAYAVGRDGNIVSRVFCNLVKDAPAKHIEVPIAVDPSHVKKTVRKIARSINRPHTDARLKEVDGQLDVTQDSSGIKLDRKGAIAAIVNAIKASRMVANLPVHEDKPDVTAEEARGMDTLLARYATPFNPGKRDRTHNLTLAARAINGVIVPRDGEFSYNTSVGPRLESTGFREAPIFVRGKMEPGVGGGICQVSSTLYNAVLMTGLKVVERYPHSRTVPYVTAGRDATVAYGSRDFRFRNPMNGAVGIVARISGARLTIDLYGSSVDKKNITVFTGPVAHTPITGSVTVFDPTLPPGSRKVVDKGSRGARVTVYRRISKPDGSSVTETVSTDRYPAQKVVIGVGPGAKASATPASASSETDAPVRRVD